MPILTHKLGQTFYSIRNKSKKKLPLIFLHGGPGGSHDSFLPLMKRITDRPSYAYDQLGTGRSSKTSKAKWNITSFVDELDVFAEKLGLDRFHLLGSSWGTTLALEYYLRKRGKRVESLIFQSPMFSAKQWAKDAETYIRKLPKKYQDIIFHCQAVGAIDAAVYKEAEEVYLKKHICRVPLPKNFFQYSNLDMYNYMWGPNEFFPTGTLKNYERVHMLSKIKVPSLFLGGQYDESHPESLKKFASMVKGSQVKVLKACSHVIGVENPELFAKTLQNFLKNRD